jgi:DNA-binding beta-propeller fold protein YncE
MGLFPPGGGSSSPEPPESTALGYFPLELSPVARLATDPKGTLYIADPLYDRLYVLSNNGVELSRLSIASPLGVAVDAQGRILVGSEDKILLLSKEGQVLQSIQGLKMPSSIATDSQGRIYVADSEAGRVMVFNSSGALLYSIGPLAFPTGLALDEAQGELFVVEHLERRVRVYDLEGAWKRDLGSEEQLHTPQGLALDAEHLYVSDAYHSAVAVFDRSGGDFLGYVGQYGSSAGEFKTPLDGAFDAAEKLFVANSENHRVEVLGIGTQYNWLSIEPAVIELSLTEGAGAVGYTIELSSHSSLSWEASVPQPWVSLSATSGQTPQSIELTIQPQGLEPGTYTALVEFSTSASITGVLKVRLQLNPEPRAIAVSPDSLEFKHQLGAPQRPSGTVEVSLSGGPFDWSAEGTESWLSVSPTVGNSSATLEVSVTEAVQELAPGTYQGKVLVQAPEAQGSPQEVLVSLRVIYAGTVEVSTNLQEASFVIEGPATYEGSGTYWSYDEVVPGSYIITFSHVPGYTKPLSQSFSIESGQRVSISAEYLPPLAATHMAVARDAPMSSPTVRLYEPEGTYTELQLLGRAYRLLGLQLADVDSDGETEIILLARERRSWQALVAVFEPDGTLLAQQPLGRAVEPARLGLADLQGDGAEEVAVSLRGSFSEPFRLLLLGYHQETLQPLAEFVPHEGALFGVEVASVDLQADGTEELITASVPVPSEGQAELKFWRLTAEGPVESGSFTIQLARQGLALRHHLALAGADLEGDGSAEVLVGLALEPRTGTVLVRTYSAEGELLGEFATTTWAGLNLAVGDLEADGALEVAVGDGPSARNQGTLRLYSPDGTLKALYRVFDRYGVMVSFGRLAEGR